MRTVFEACEPRPEVLSGELKEEIFAARLQDVLEGHAEAVYQHPVTFFENTFPTSGLRTLLDEALGRLTGKKPTNSPVIRLETAFGGGKTHNLIALYHLTRGVKKTVPAALLQTFVDPELVPSSSISRVTGVVGSDLGAAEAFTHGEITTHTLWGEIAYRLRGPEGYRLVEDSDRRRVTPGAHFLNRLIGDEPALIMLDELARYLRGAKGMVGETSLAEQTVAFLLSLLEFAASKANVVVVFTLADPKDAFGKETEELRQELAEASRVSARQERVITPTTETEISAVVSHRLFRRIDRAAAREVAEAYSRYFESLVGQGTDLPGRVSRAEYVQEIVNDYPFHPELLTALNRKTSTIPNFQKTRGALRLLAMVIRDLWTTRPAQTYLIHPHHVDLAVQQIVEDLTSRLERPQYKQVVEADIVSPKKGVPAHAQVTDQAWVEVGKPPYAARVATTAFLHSLTQGVATGVDPADLLAAVLQPGDDPALITKATERLVDTCWFLDWDGHRYRFKTEPSLNKIIADEMAVVGRVKAKEELDRRIKHVWKKGTFDPVYFRSEASEVDDDAGLPKLVVIHYDAAASDPAAKTPPELVLKLFEHAGSLEGYRTYKNNLLFLVADRDQVDHMVEVAQRYLAIERIVGDPERLGEFNEEQRKKLKGLLDSAELLLRVAITRAYKYLYYPSADAPAAAGHLSRETLPAQDQGEVEQDQTRVLLRVLRQLDKVWTDAEKPLAAAFVKAKAWPSGHEAISTEDLRRAFAQRLGLRILLDPQQLKRTIKDGVAQGVWIYYDPEEQAGYGLASPAPLVRISEDVELYTPDEARRRGIAIKGEDHLPPVCPVCGKSPCVCGEEEEKAKPVRLHAEGAPAQVFQAIADQAHDRKVPALRTLFVRAEGAGKEAVQDLRALGLAVPQLGKGDYRIELSMGAEFGNAEVFSTTFAGTWDRYKRLKQVTDAFGQEAAKVNVKITLRADFPEGLPFEGEQYQAIRDVFTTLNLGRLVVDADPRDLRKEG